MLSVRKKLWSVYSTISKKFLANTQHGGNISYIFFVAALLAYAKSEKIISRMLSVC